MKSKYKSLDEFRKKDYKHYKKAYVEGWLDLFCERYGWEKLKKVKPSGYWQIKENVINEARKYKTKSEWSVKGSTSYNSAKKNGWYDECVTHMIIIQVPKGYWKIKENIINDGRKYKTRVEWKKNSPGGNSAALKTEWYEEATAHMIRPKKKDGYWTKERCIKEAKKYKSVNEWRKKSSGSADAAQAKGWMLECKEHMVYADKPDGYWTKEKCLESAKNYKTKTEWRWGNKSAYYKSRTEGWYDECVAHMVDGRKPKGYWSKERCHQEALKYTTLTEWKKKSGSSYYASERKKWLIELSQHMK